MKRITKILGITAIVAVIAVGFVALSLTGCSGSYDIGDKGPGGGLIIYVNRAGFEVEGYGTAYYLEAAPVIMETSLRWVAESYGNNWQSFPDVEGTETKIGSGRKNTDLILAVDPNAPAAKACVDYRGGGKRDWFLPSGDELNALYEQRALFVDGSRDRFWSSSQSFYNSAWTQDFAYGGRDGSSNYYGYKTNDHLVRAVRAF